MILYDSIGPNPRMVRMLVAEKGTALEARAVDILGGENRGEAFLRINPAGELPALALDDGTVLTESYAICEYLDETLPGPTLYGASAEERALARMWARRVDVRVNRPIGDGFRYAEGLKMFEKRIHCIPQAADDFKLLARQGLSWFDEQLGDSEWIAGSRFTIADIALFSFLDFGAQIGQGLDGDACPRLAAWMSRVSGRASVAASAKPAAAGAAA